MRTAVGALIVTTELASKNILHVEFLEVKKSVGYDSLASAFLTSVILFSLSSFRTHHSDFKLRIMIVRVNAWGLKLVPRRIGEVSLQVDDDEREIVIWRSTIVGFQTFVKYFLGSLRKRVPRHA